MIDLEIERTVERHCIRIGHRIKFWSKKSQIRIGGCYKSIYLCYASAMLAEKRFFLLLLFQSFIRLISTNRKVAVFISNGNMRKSFVTFAYFQPRTKNRTSCLLAPLLSPLHFISPWGESPAPRYG